MYIYVLHQTLECSNLSMQAENAVDQMDWIEKINGVIASLLACQSPQKVITTIFVKKNKLNGLVHFCLGEST